MNRFTQELRLKILEIYYKNNGSHRATHTIFDGLNCSTDSAVQANVEPIRTMFNVEYNACPQRCRTVCTDETFAAVEQSIEVNPNEFSRQQLKL